MVHLVCIGRSNEHVPELLPGNESEEGDNSPVGMILCSGKDEASIRYATMGLPQKVFVTKWLVNLPSEEELKGVLEKERLEEI